MWIRLTCMLFLLVYFKIIKYFEINFQNKNSKVSKKIISWQQMIKIIDKKYHNQGD